ncbi:TonB-dependent receptor plug domain-containing protein [Undibacterium sp.]|uniref:TonB-dependent receptor plug domain-containing protein n=1 Tax=Undibacterium sp. TaxID=1914977 RepID=UPI00374FF389
MKNKSTTSGCSPKQEMFAKSAVQIAILMLATGGFANAQDASPSKPAAAQEVQTITVTGTGTRGKQRTQTDTPVAVDILSATELTKTAQTSLDKALQYRVPSFSTVQTPVNDATSLLDPYEIRNMGPSRALILINGKRKNASALVYTQTSPGRGESGADISAIPQDAIKRVEILRDGAAAQYGSDAIAGVVNIILKDDPTGTSFTAKMGRTAQGDGKSHAISLNHGMALSDRGFLNFTVDVSKNGLANRPGILNAQDEADYWGTTLAVTAPFLAKYPDGGNINGSPDTKAAKFLVNTRYEIADDVNIYANAAYIDKDVSSFANYRVPYWKTEADTYGLLNKNGKYEGYVPTFLGSLKDYNATVGTKFEVDGWAADLSLTVGGNEQRYRVTNSINFDMANDYAAAKAAGKPLPPQSPSSFEAGGTDFSHTVWNADFSKEISTGVNAYFGSEIRSEKYKIVAGDFASSYGAGANSYAGNSVRDAGTFKRSNYGIYGGASFDVSKELVIDTTARYEKYSDFGNALIGKVASRYKVSNQLTLRASVSSGFRAPSLHQIFTQKKEYTFSGGNIQVSGLASNISKEVEALKIPKLKAEKSESFTLGLGFNPSRDTSMTIDYYNIAVKDRIVLSESIGSGTGPGAATLNKILADNSIVGIKFFSNAISSKTSGIDYVFNHRNMDFADGKLAFNVAGNYTLQNKRTGAVNNVASIAAAGKTVFGSVQDALMFTSRPKFKTIFGFDLDYQDINFSVNNTVFGPTRFNNADLGTEDLNVVFKTKTLTDFGVNYKLTKNVTLAFNINNIFDVTPSWKLEAVNNKAAGEALLAQPAKVKELVSAVTFNGRYPMVTYDGSHFSQLGRMYNLSLNYRF